MNKHREPDQLQGVVAPSTVKQSHPSTLETSGQLFHVSHLEEMTLCPPALLHFYAKPIRLGPNKHKMTHTFDL